VYAKLYIAYRDTLEEKLQAVGIRAKEIKTTNNDCGDWKAFVKIEPSRREKMTEASQWIEDGIFNPRLILPPPPYIGWKFKPKYSTIYTYYIVCEKKQNK
jgi:hypothetical protein